MTVAISTALGYTINEEEADRLWARRNRAAKRPWVYIAGPMLSVGGPYTNVQHGVMAGEEAWRKGWVPIVPHMNAFAEMAGAVRNVEEWLECDFALIERCNAICFLPGSHDSTGAREEAALVALLKMRGWENISVYVGIQNLPPSLAWYREEA